MISQAVLDTPPEPLASSRTVAITARAMPPADSRLPLRAVAGEQVDQADDRVQGLGVHGQPSASGFATGAGFFLNIWSIRSVTT